MDNKSQNTRVIACSAARQRSAQSANTSRCRLCVWLAWGAQLAQMALQSQREDE